MIYQVKKSLKIVSLFSQVFPGNNLISYTLQSTLNSVCLKVEIGNSSTHSRL